MDSPHRGLTAHRRFWVVVFALVSLGVMAGGLEYYRYEQDHIRREKYQELAAIADLKVRQILEWRRERIDDGRSMARDPFLGKAIAEWLRDPGNPGLRAALLERLKEEKEGGAYGNVLLTDPGGRILLSVRPDPTPLSPAGKQALEAAVAGRQAVLGDLFRCPKDHRVHLDVVAPVQDPRGQPLAVVVLRTNADEILYPLIQSWPTPSLTAETLLVEVEGKDILFLNELRHREKTALSLREPLTQKDLPAVQAGLGKQGVFEGRDYRGKKVLADLRPVPQSPWFMVAKVDTDEILAEVRYRAGVTTLFIVIFILLTAAVTAYGYRQRQANLYQDLYQTERERRQAQEEFRTTLYSIGDAVITTDTAGLVKQVNSVAERLTGWLEAEARGRAIEEVFHILNEETRTPVENPVHRVLREGKVVGLGNHTLLIARDGTESPIADSGAPIRDENGAVNGVVLVFRDQTEERAAQNALRESEEHYRSLFDNMLNGFAYCKMLFDQNQAQDFIYLNVNNSFEELTGLKNVEGKRVSEVIPGIRESDPELIEIYGRVALTGKPERLETYVKAMKMWFSISVYSPKKEHFVAIFDVITERKRAEEALRASEERYRTVADYTYDMEYWVDPDGKVLYMSPACERFTGYSFQAFQEDPQLLFQILHPEDQALFVNHEQNEHHHNEPINLDFRFIHRNGQEFWINHSCQPVFGADGQPMGRRASNRDITERKQAEEAFQSLVTHAPMGIYIVQHGKFAMINPGFEAITGYNAQELLGQECLSPVSPEFKAKVRKKALQRLKGKVLPPYEYQFINKSGETGWVMETVTPTQYKGKRAVLGYFMDITPLKKLEAQFLQAQKMEAVGRLAGGVAHDFNNILGVIMGYAEIMLMRLNEKDSLCGPVEEIKHAAVRAASLTRQLLAFSRKQIQQLEVFNLNEIITDLEKMLHRLIGEDLELVMGLDSALPSVKADKGQVEQIILNLAVNAKDAMPQGGKLTIETCDVYLDETYCRDHPYVSPGPFVMLAVSDNGTGMDEETRAHIFEPFYTTKETGKGTGLGLSTVFGIVKQSGGSVEVYSEPGFGTTIKVYFPSTEKPAERPQAEIYASPFPGHETILVVEDDDGLRPLITEVLRMYGYEVLGAKDGDEALRICKDYEGPIHLMLTDVVMPRMSGGQLAGQMASLYPQMQVLFMSGYTDNAIVHHGVLLEDTAYIQKPFSPDDLAKKVREVLATSFSK